MAELGTLRQVALREAWDHEAHRFTPWLYKHLDLLGDAIGMGLEPVEREAQVGPFSADILAHAAGDESHRVLIENQLEGSDHTHLGQIMTYLGGLDARTVIWVAAGFEEKHLSAFQWLNEHTHEDCAFFAVAVKAVRIDDSRPAPQFEVVARPNHWERQHRHEARKGVSELRRSFLEHVATSDPESWKDVQSGGNNYASYSSEGNKMWANFVIEMYCLIGEVGIRLLPKQEVTPEQATDCLNPWAERLREHLDVEMKYNRYPHAFFHQHKNTRLTDRAQWPELACWLTEKLNLYRSAIDELPATPPAA